ncbi:MAG TPA: AAA family ATPase, partial [Gemmata sp.]|nr:AAA family ATPase [Gemmata sp.]
RARRGIPRDCHGDLHLDHIYHLPDRASPGDLAIIDCIEFNERFRFIDPVADMAFATMDFEYHGRRDLAQAFSDAYFHASGDDEGRELLSLYVAYRATVRGMVEGLLKGEKEVPVAERAAALARARGHWLLALGALAPPGERPCLLLVGGLPGTGKSTLARRLAEEAGFGVIRSDVVRKELAGIPIDFPTPSERREELYSSESTERTYRECLHRAEQHLFEGNRVIVDATFREERYRRMFRAAATRNGVPFLFFGCAARPETIQSRLAARRDDASDADWEVHTRLKAEWEHPPREVASLHHTLSTEVSTESAARQALAILRDEGLVGRL